VNDLRDETGLDFRGLYWLPYLRQFIRIFAYSQTRLDSLDRFWRKQFDGLVTLGDGGVHLLINDELKTVASRPGITFADSFDILRKNVSDFNKGPAIGITGTEAAYPLMNVVDYPICVRGGGRTDDCAKILLGHRKQIPELLKQVLAIHKLLESEEEE
jgi:hypothetical protein